MTRSFRVKNATPHSIARYSRLGGVAGAFEAFRSGVMSLHAIGETEGVSCETVRRDMIREFGHEIYDGAIATLYPKRVVHTYSISEAISVIRQSARREGHRHHLAFAATLERIRQHAPTVEAKMSPYGAWTFEFGGRPLYVRSAIPEERHKEFFLGLFRLKISPAAEAGISLISLCSNEPPFRPVAVYLFRTEEIDSIQSLHLRFDRFGTRFKWEFGRERWDLLSSAVLTGKSRRKRVSLDRK